MANLLTKLWQSSPQRAGRGARVNRAVAALHAVTQAPFCGQLLRDQQGQDMTEYALLAAMMASIVVAIMPGMLTVALHTHELLLSLLQAVVNFSTLQ
jgi:Flp pilus assembly pilin Flp